MLNYPIPIKFIQLTNQSTSITKWLSVNFKRGALEQVLWVEKSPGQGSWSPAASKLRADVRDAVGKLLGQLYDRNCHRAFVPTEAFHIDNLPPERFHAEVNAAAAARGGLMEASHTRVWLILRCGAHQGVMTGLLGHRCVIKAVAHPDICKALYQGDASCKGEEDSENMPACPKDLAGSILHASTKVEP